MNIQAFHRALAVVSALAVGSPLLAGDALPPAPDLAAPPTLAEAKLWLDAWDYATFQTDEAGFVTNWIGKGVGGVGARTYEAAELGKVGVTNGVPAFLMGDVGSGIDLQFDYLSDVRTVFWVMDALPYVKDDSSAIAKAQRVELLACSVSGASRDFARNSQTDAFFHWTAPAFAGRFWLGDKYLFTWNDRRWSAKNNSGDTKGLQVYALASDKNLRADRLSAVRGQEGSGPEKTNGGRALSELVIFDRTLPVGEVLMVKSYLNAKYKGIAPQTIDAATTPTAVTGYGDLTLGANAAFTLTDAVLDAERAAPVNVWGKFDKSAAGKIRLVYQGHVYNRRQALFCVGKGGLTLDDFEVSGLPADAELTCDGQTLWLRRVNPVLPSAILADASANGPKLWLDASKADSFVTDEATGDFLRWRDQSPNRNDATNYVFEGKWRNPTVGVTNGVPALIMGRAGSGVDLAFNAMDDIRTVFWAMDVEQDRLACFLGFYTNGWAKLNQVDGYTEHRRQAYMRSANGRTVGGVARSGFFMHCTTNSVLHGEMLEDGVFPQDTAPNDTGDDRLRWVAPHEGLHVFSHRVKDDVPAWANNLGRCRANTTTCSAGKNLSELAIFNRSLTDGEIAEVTAQLRAKWQGHAAETKLVKETTVDAPCAYSMLVLDRESISNGSLTEASIVLKASALTAGKPAITVFGEFRRGDIAKCVFTWAGDAIAPGDYTLLVCANRFNCEPADFAFNGFPGNAYLYWRGTNLMMTIMDEVEPLVPEALTAAGEAAPWLWLDASAAATFTTNAQGGVLAWADRGARGNDAEAYQLGDTQVYGTVGVTNGVMAFLMGDPGSCIDLVFPRTTAARTLFWVMDIALSRDADFLGDTTAENFRRGDGGQYSYYEAPAQEGWLAGTILEDGDIPHDKKVNPNWENWRLKPYAPPAVHVYSLQAGADMAADCLSAENGSLTRNGGRALSELVVFNRALTAAEFNAVEAYLDCKWLRKSVTVSTAIEATARIDYPNLECDEGAAFTVDAKALSADGAAAITVYGRLVKLFDGKIRIEHAGGRVRAGVTLLRCAMSAGVDLDGFDFVGFPAGTKFAWVNNELKIASVERRGLTIFVR